MKKLFTILLIMPLIWACSSDEDTIQPDTNKEYIISLGFTGEITDITESPLTRATTSDLYGIQIYSEVQGELHPYAYGLFDQTQDIRIKLLKGNRYKISCTMVIEGKNRIERVNYRYGLPFWAEVSNKFIYSNTDYFHSINMGTADLIDNNRYNKPTIDRYYGELDITPNDNTPISVFMKRVSFGLKIIVDGLTEGKIKISMDNTPTLYINYPESSIESIFSLYKLSDAYNNNNYSEVSFTTITWIKDNGESIPLTTEKISFKRNKLITATLKVGDSLVQKDLSINKESGIFNESEEIILHTPKHLNK